MPEKPVKISIINRSFWPLYPVIGEALLQFAEGAAKRGFFVSVFMQDHVGIKGKLAENSRGKGVRLYPSKAFTTSASGISFRIFDAFFFMICVMLGLLWVRPKKVYVSTDPPIVVPFVVMLYSQLFAAEYTYHIQDIHPEATNVIIPVNKWIYKLLLKMDALSMRKATRLITITNQMVTEIRLRSQTKAEIHVLPNPSVSFDFVDISKPKAPGFSFCGNAGRMQRIPLMLSAIETYFKRGGRLDFTFAGGGVYANHLKEFSKKYPKFHYRGFVSSTEAAQINADYKWALLPIEDQITRFAFPSKSSSYILSGANILAVCSEETSVAQWVNTNRLGLVAKPDLEALVTTFFDIENGAFQDLTDKESRDAQKEALSFEVFIEALNRVILS